jgi:multimeric flavodoxin WrbA
MTISPTNSILIIEDYQKGGHIVTLILGISGSPRTGGNTDTLLEQFLNGAKEAGAQTEQIFLRNYSIHPCIGCEKCRKTGTCKQFDDGMQLLYPLIEKSRGIIIGSPTYNYNVTAGVKAFIDRLYPYYIFNNDRPRKWSSRLQGQGRTAIVFGVCEQTDPHDMGYTIEAMSNPLGALGYKIVNEFRAIGYFDRNAVEQNRELLDSAFQAGRELGRTIE